MFDMLTDSDGKLSFFRVMGLLFGIIAAITIISSLCMVFLNIESAIAFGGMGFGVIPLILGTKALQKKFEK